GIFAVQAFREFLYGYFGMARPFRAPKAPEEEVVVLSPNKRAYAPGELIDLLIIPDQNVGGMNSTIALERFEWPRGQVTQVAALKQISFQAGPSRSIPVEVTAPVEPGGYRLTMAGSHRTIEGTHAWFIVSETARRTTKIKRVARRRKTSRKIKKRK